ncbi:electron transfer flavoprotein alpha subunit apoprotein [Dethiosulfatibacter aminovorans DSM 17477]|uniref:Electron transfer flavoprotein alpha subunit apoprotein n=1 Tax=Dethiosulfatibacter aminovorans DSM 17477 TaxID=1121476 RepID=A0A1M6BPM7_9FIRM|nr:electron transfer flavoprotein subunit alpha/FixB family protein [Dethiosulfatibacter aminovorans]SHI50574.1 electron transfer flavoprotein alpha subunit apoprotein [Dethiosulfatibacter aminovorans DSM 17477]
MKDFTGVMVYAEQKDGVIHKVSYELLGKARQLADELGEEVLCCICGPSNLDLQELIYRGADKVYHVKDDDIFSIPEILTYSKNVVKVINDVQPEICLFGATSFGRSLAPRVAAALKCGLTADCTGLEIDQDDKKLVQIRPAFSENILAHIKSDYMPQMSTVRYKEFDEAKSDEGRKGEVEVIEPVVIENNMIQVLKEITEEDFNITDAEIVVSAGKGLKTSEDFKMIKELADVLGGVVGSSRPLVEDGFISKAHQVGYSGNRVKPKLYIACGISGAPQHQAGMKESEMILAINSDPSAPIFNIADYGIVGDMYEVIPQMIDKINSQKALV